MQKGAKYDTEDVSPTSGTMDIYGPGAFKLDFAVQDGVPWRHERTSVSLPHE